MTWRGSQTPCRTMVWFGTTILKQESPGGCIGSKTVVNLSPFCLWWGNPSWRGSFHFCDLYGRWEKKGRGRSLILNLQKMTIETRCDTPHPPRGRSLTVFKKMSRNYDNRNVNWPHVFRELTKIKKVTVDQVTPFSQTPKGKLIELLSGGWWFRTYSQINYEESNPRGLR